MKNLLIKIALSVGVTAAIYVVALLTTGENFWCFEDKDTCAINQIVYYRNLRDQQLKDEQDRHATTVATINDYYNEQKINPLKLTLSAGAVIKEAKEGDKRNVPQEFFTLKSSLVPIAHADNGDGWINDVEIKDQDSITTAQGSKKPLRYQALLASVGSPYADVDIESYCLNAELTQYQCDLLVGIGHSESASGTNFASTKLPREEAIKLGKEVYHNPAGLKRCIEVSGTQISPVTGDRVPSSTECPDPTKIPDENGMWIQKYDSWEQFWITYTYQMKDRYFVRGAENPADISRSYVGNNRAVKEQWVNRVESFINKI